MGAAALLGGAALGSAALVVAEGGARDRPVLAGALLVIGAAAGLAPFRYGLPAIVLLSAFEGYMLDFAGDTALYFNELFAVVVAARSAAAKRPTWKELVAAATVGLVYAAYVATGSSTSAAGWGAKVLLTSVVVLWALARLELGWREWRSVYYGFAAAAVAALVLAVWQRSLGVRGLADLGLVYGERIRETAGGGVVRASGGFTSPAPFSYMLGIALCCWTALLLGGLRERHAALATLWLPPVAAAGIVLAVDRTAAIALLVGLLALAATHKARVVVPVVAAGALVLAAAAAVASAWGHFGGDVGSAARARTTLWAEYLRDFRPFGAGPASVGSAYDKVDPDDWVTPLRIPQEWRVSYHRVTAGNEALAVLGSPREQRPRLVVRADARSLTVPRLVTATLGYDPVGGRPLLEQRIPVGRAVRVALAVPAGRGEAPVWVRAPTVRAAAGSAPAVATLVNLVTDPSIERAAAGWEPTAARAVGVAWRGKSSLRVVDADGIEISDQGALYGPLYLERGRTYAFSAHVKGASGGERVFVALVDEKPETAPHGTVNGGLELGIGGWAPIAGVETLRRDTAQAKFGRASLRVELPEEAAEHGAYVRAPEYRAGTAFVASGWFKGVAGRGYFVRVTSAAGEERGTTRFTATGAWQPVSVSATAVSGDRNFWIAFRRDARGGRERFHVDGVMTEPIARRSPPAGRELRLSTGWRRGFTTFRIRRKNVPVWVAVRSARSDGAAQTYFVDGVQLEEASRPSPYCDGSIDRCRWIGTPHASWSLGGGLTRLAAGVRRSAPARVEALRVRSTWLPMPQRPPFEVLVGAEAMTVLRIVDGSTYRVRRGALGTVPEAHAAGATVAARVKPLRRAAREIGLPIGFRPRRGGLAAAAYDPSAETRTTPVLELLDVRVDGRPPPRTPAERVWERWFARTPAALEGDGPGLVDNQYVSWLYEYGLLGVGLCAAWLGALLWPLASRSKETAVVAARAVGVFVAVAGVAVSVWEEAPTDLFVAILLAVAWSESRRRPRGRPATRSTPAGRR